MFNMIVYRRMSSNELEYFLNNELEKIGKYYENGNFEGNTHRYKQNEKYVHFFKNLNDLPLIQYYQGLKPGYVVEFDIPVLTLVLGTGRGYYYNYTSSGYDDLYGKIIEFAIPSRKLKAEYLVNMVQDVYINDDGNTIVLTPEDVKNKFKNQEDETKYINNEQPSK